MKENSIKKDIIIIFLIAMFVLAILFLQRGKITKIKSGSKAPNFTATDINGNKISLSDYKGKVVLVNFWATWCSPCKEEIPQLNKLYKIMQNRDFVILAIAEDNKSSNELKAFIKKYEMPFTVLTDPGRVIAGYYRLSGVPETFLIDKNGKLIYKFIGPKDWTGEELSEIFEKLINKKE